MTERLALIHERSAAGPALRWSHSGPPVPVPLATSARPVVGGIVALMKRTVRRSVSWYVTPQVSGLLVALARLQELAATTLGHHRHDLNRVARRLGYVEGGASVYRSRLTEIESRLADVERKVGLETPSDPERG